MLDYVYRVVEQKDPDHSYADYPPVYIKVDQSYKDHLPVYKVPY